MCHDLLPFPRQLNDLPYLYINMLVCMSVTVQRSIGNVHTYHSWQHANSKQGRKGGQALEFLAMDLTHNES